MTALPLSVLALAAGIYLLIKVNCEYLGGLFKFLAWLVILLSVVSIVGVARHMVHRHMHGGCGMHGECGMHEKIMIKEFKHCEMDGDSTAPMAACKMMGDSMVMDRAMCEKMMGKEACDKMCKERGQCVMTKDECAKMCGGTMKCSAGQPACCKEGDKACCKGADKACCKGGEEKEMKSCCKK